MSLLEVVHKFLTKTVLSTVGFLCVCSLKWFLTLSWQGLPPNHANVLLPDSMVIDIYVDDVDGMSHRVTSLYCLEMKQMAYFPMHWSNMCLIWEVVGIRSEPQYLQWGGGGRGRCPVVEWTRVDRTNHLDHPPFMLATDLPSCRYQVLSLATHQWWPRWVWIEFSLFELGQFYCSQYHTPSGPDNPYVAWALQTTVNIVYFTLTYSCSPYIAFFMLLYQTKVCSDPWRSRGVSPWYAPLGQSGSVSHCWCLDLVWYYPRRQVWPKLLHSLPQHSIQKNDLNSKGIQRDGG